jgi:hypothetical protein
MKKELQNILFEKYPTLFMDKDAPATETCMCWGITCGDGWYNILDDLCNRIMVYFTFHPQSVPHFSQVKEKFGTLHVYVESYKDEVDYEIIEKMISDAKNESSHVCEHCGSRENVTHTKKGRIKILCKVCMKEEEGGILDGTL